MTNDAGTEAEIDDQASAGHRVLSRTIGTISRHPTIAGRITATVTYAIKETIGNHTYTHKIDVKSWTDSWGELDPDAVSESILSRSDRVIERTMSHILAKK